MAESAAGVGRFSCRGVRLGRQEAPDGIVEAHSPSREMLGFERLQALVAEHAGGPSLVDRLLDDLSAFTGPDWEQEDDVTLLVLERLR